MIDTEFTRLDELQAIERRRRLRPDEALEKTQLARAAEAEATEQKRILKRGQLREAIDREAAARTAADKLWQQLALVEAELENADDANWSRLLAKKSGVKSKLARLAEKSGGGFQPHQFNQKLVALSSPEARANLDYCADVVRRWTELVRILEDPRSYVDGTVILFVREQIELAKRECQLAETRCIEED